jgi:predicted DNA-binding ribbon-helix-helix protein
MPAVSGHFDVIALETAFYILLDEIGVHANFLMSQLVTRADK